MPPRAPINEFYCIDIHNLEPGDLINALKALTEGRLTYYMAIGRDSQGKAHAFRFFLDQKGLQPAVLEVGDEEALLPAMATRFNKSVARVRYDVDKQEGVLHVSDNEGKLHAHTYKFEPLPPFPGRLFERPLSWQEPVWMATSTPAGRPERPMAGTPGYDVPLEKGSYIGAFAAWKGTTLDAVKTEFERNATGELTLQAADAIEARVWFEQGQIVGMVFDTMRGANPDKTWEAIQKETFAKRRFRINVPRPDHVPFVKAGTPKLLGLKK